MVYTIRSGHSLSLLPKSSPFSHLVERDSLTVKSTLDLLLLRNSSLFTLRPTTSGPLTYMLPGLSSPECTFGTSCHTNLVPSVIPVTVLYSTRPSGPGVVRPGHSTPHLLFRDDVRLESPVGTSSDPSYDCTSPTYKTFWKLAAHLFLTLPRPYFVLRFTPDDVCRSFLY